MRRSARADEPRPLVWHQRDDGVYVPAASLVRREGWRIEETPTGWLLHRGDAQLDTFVQLAPAKQRVTTLRRAARRAPPLRSAPIEDKDDDDSRFYGGGRE